MKHSLLSPLFWLGELVISFFLGVDKNLQESFAWNSMSKNVYFQFFDYHMYFPVIWKP